MRIAFAVLKYFPFGGLERDMLRMAESAAERGHRVVIHTSKWEDDAPLPENIEVRLFPLKNIANHRRMQEFEQKFEQAVKESVFDVKVAFNRIGGCDFYFAADNCYAVEMPKKHSKWVLSLLPRYRAFLLQERKVFSPESSTRVFYITPHQKEDFIRSYGTQEERFLYLPPGINGKCVRPANADEIRAAKRRELGVAEEERMLLQVASNYKLKGGDRSIEALSSLPESLRKRCRLFFAGVPDGGAGESLARKLHLERQVVFLGGRKDVPELLLAADLLVHPARNEATGTVLAEAIAAGLPLISSGVCGFRNFVEDAGCPVVAEPWNQGAFNRSLAEVLEHQDEYRERALKHASEVDFCRRADVAVDFMEQFAGKSRKK